jgi:peptidoglycan/LPS O-acetylase OafA/YrhL
MRSLGRKIPATPKASGTPLPAGAGGAERRVDAYDGIRALACAAVLASHSGIQALHGGWFGVDIFFVLSGYLITGLLLKELSTTGTIELRRFWVRRAARLYPALILAVGLAVILPSQTTYKDGAIALVYLANISRWYGHNIHALGHTWSLALEEQFYVLWPLVVILAGSRSKVRRAAIFGTIASLVILFLMSSPFSVMTVASYNAPIARMWELLTGCVLVASIHRLPRSHRFTRAMSVSASSLMVVAVIAAGLNAKLAILMLFIVIATALSIIAIQRGGWIARPLEIRPLPYLGRISYGIYLYHLPIVFALNTTSLPLPVKVTIFPIATVILAALSSTLIENPIRNRVSRIYAARTAEQPRTPAPLKAG